MMTLSVPDKGLTLSGGLGAATENGVPNLGAVQQAMRLDLEDGVLQNILRSARSGGKGVHLSFGKTVVCSSTIFLSTLGEVTDSQTQTLSFGNRSKPLSATTQSTPTEIYTYNSEKPEQLTLTALQSHRLSLEQAQESTMGTDAALAKLQESLASHEREKQSRQIQLADGVNLPPKLSKRDVTQSSKTSAMKNHTQSQRSMNNPSRSVSNNTSHGLADPPHLTGPSTMAPSAEDRKIQKTKAIRIPLIHFLAVRPVSMKYLAQTLGCKDEECKEVLERVGRPYRLDNSKWDLTDKAYRELNVHLFKYPSEDDRKLALDRAISAYDRMRLSPNDALWQRLLPVHERGKGKVISKLNLTKATTPRISVQTPRDPAAGGVTPSNDSDARLDRLAPSDAEPMARSKSKDPAKKTKPGSKNQSVSSKGPLKPSKVQKPNEKASPKLTANDKKAAKKVAPAKFVTKSSEFVHDSDEDEDEDMIDAPATTITSTKSSVLESSNKSVKPINSDPNGRLKSTQPGNIVGPKKASPSIPGTLKDGNKPKSGGKGDLQHHNKRQNQSAEQKLPPSSSSSSESKHNPSDSSQTSATIPSTKKQEPLKQKPNAPNQKHDQARPRTTSSPHKPSPLGSSPPANASELDEQNPPKSRPSTSTSKPPSIEQKMPSVWVPNVRKRKRKPADTNATHTSPHRATEDPMEVGGVEADAGEEGAKRRKKVDTSPTAPMSPPTSVEAVASDPETEWKQAVQAGLRFTQEYNAYEALYREVAAWDGPTTEPHPRYYSLMAMHNRMEKYKKQCFDAAANAAVNAAANAANEGTPEA